MVSIVCMYVFVCVCVCVCVLWMNGAQSVDESFEEYHHGEYCVYICVYMYIYVSVYVCMCVCVVCG